jgi:archaellum component FlaC
MNKGLNMASDNHMSVDSNASLKRRLDLSFEAVQKLEARIKHLTSLNLILEDKNEQLIKARTVSEKIIQDTLNNVNKQSDEYLQEINRLRKEIKALRKE